MTTQGKYQGWANYETWITALWFDNDEATSKMLSQWAEDERINATHDENVKYGIWTAEEASKFKLADRIKKYTEAGNPLATQANLYTDLLHAAISEVDWHEIAEHYLNK